MTEASPNSDKGRSSKENAKTAETDRIADEPTVAVSGNENSPSVRLRVDTSALTSSYCNVCNASTTREEVVLNFGVNHDWDRGQTGADVKMLHRIILSPFAARRVSQLLVSLLKEYEARHGELK